MWFVLLSRALGYDCLLDAQSAVADADMVPANVDLTFHHVWEEPGKTEFVLTQDGETVPTASEDFRYRTTLTPVQPLQSGGQYELMGWRIVDGERDVALIHTDFVVGDAVDGVAPEVPEILNLQHHTNLDYEELVGIQVRVSTVQEAAYYEYDVSRSEDFEPRTRGVSVSTEGILGRYFCEDWLPQYKRTKGHLVRARAVDLAGNRSAWSETARLEPIPAEASEGCSLVGGSTSSVFLLAASGVFLRRRQSGEVCA